MKYIVFLSCIVFSQCNSATELVYTPINPSFGGNPINGSFLLGKAQSQNAHSAPLIEKSYAEKFQESLERAYISQIVREITDFAFGDAEEGNAFLTGDALFTSGDYEILVLTSSVDVITVQITNTTNGEITVIEVPRFG